MAGIKESKVEAAVLLGDGPAFNVLLHLFEYEYSDAFSFWFGIAELAIEEETPDGPLFSDCVVTVGSKQAKARINQFSTESGLLLGLVGLSKWE
ncbi:MAG: hypothetical protein HYV60_19555 [Planctomycetia bacterium]|nr:hypothetical protein [Planctomycetia bacterium]